MLSKPLSVGLTFKQSIWFGVHVLLELARFGNVIERNIIHMWMASGSLLQFSRRKYCASLQKQAWRERQEKVVVSFPMALQK